MPNESWPQLAIKILDWFKSATHFMTMIFILCGLVLIVPQRWLQAIGHANLSGQYRFFVWLAFLFSGLFLLTRQFFDQETTYRQWRNKEKVKKRLRDLTKIEKEILKRYVAENTTTLKFHGSFCEVSSLELEGILVPVPAREHGVVKTAVWYVLPIWILKHLRKHPELLDS